MCRERERTCVGSLTAFEISRNGLKGFFSSLEALEAATRKDGLDTRMIVWLVIGVYVSIRQLDSLKAKRKC